MRAFDIGEDSIGWASIQQDLTGAYLPFTLDAGSIVGLSCRDPKTLSTLNEGRRAKRSARKNADHAYHRIMQLRHLLISIGIPVKKEPDRHTVESLVCATLIHACAGGSSKGKNGPRKPYHYSVKHGPLILNPLIDRLPVEDLYPVLKTMLSRRGVTYIDCKQAEERKEKLPPDTPTTPIWNTADSNARDWPTS